MWGWELLYIDKRQEALDMHSYQYCWSVLIWNKTDCFLCLHISVFHHWLHWSVALWRLLRSEFSRALSQTGKQALSEDTVQSGIEDTLSWEGHKGKSELEKHSRELEEDEGVSKQCQNVWREIFSEAGFEAAFKGSWSQAVPELRDTSHTSRQNSATERPDTPIKCWPCRQNMHSIYTIGILRLIPSMQAETERQYTQKQTTEHTNTALGAVQGSDLRRWMKICSPSGVETGWAEMREVTTNTAWVFHSKSSLQALLIQYASRSWSCDLRWMHSHSFTLSLFFMLANASRPCSSCIQHSSLPDRNKCYWRNIAIS